MIHSSQRIMRAKWCIFRRTRATPILYIGESSVDFCGDSREWKRDRKGLSCATRLDIIQPKPQASQQMRGCMRPKRTAGSKEVESRLSLLLARGLQLPFKEPKVYAKGHPLNFNRHGVGKDFIHEAFKGLLLFSRRQFTAVCDVFICLLHGSC